MRIVVAPQEFKGTLTARQAAEAMAEGARKAAAEAKIETIPLSDGGPGLVEALVASAGGRTKRTRVLDPLGRPIEAEWAALAGGAAVIEMGGGGGAAVW